MLSHLQEGSKSKVLASCPKLLKLFALANKLFVTFVTKLNFLVNYLCISQKILQIMSLRLGDKAPNFTADTTKGEINFHEWIGDSWAVLYSHPADFTPVCTTEIGRTANLSDEFEKRNTKPIVLSVDSVEDHKKWIQDVNETQHADVQFPIIADPNRNIAEIYDMIHPNATDKFTIRSVFFIGPDKAIKTILSYPPSIGRNFSEILRIIDALQMAEGYGVATPVDWQPGMDVVVPPQISTADAKEKFSKGVTELKPYLRMTPDPSN